MAWHQIKWVLFGHFSTCLRFDSKDFKDESNQLKQEISSSPLSDFIFNNEHVRRVLLVSASDKVSGFLFKHCADQLSGVFYYISKQSLEQQRVRALWEKNPELFLC
ncbi:hypothetical protein ATANTOWER_024808 [Ataeniobius toweri]|uniref:Uncharacterized protein n=1 Tax=Ataeniobius toweri TaxID=208326 RepID=A0ABU7CDA8_9TELE|nr:hypothetical protein [Ataeniobius toweri]